MHRIAAIALRAGRRQRPQSFSTKPSSLSRSESLAPAQAGLRDSSSGLSPEFRELLQRRAQRGGDLPVLYSNPGAYGQLARVSDEVVSALPPPPRPLYPMTEAAHTWRLARGFSIGLLFVALALYLHLKRSMRGGARLELERRAPLLARALEAAGVLESLAALERPAAEGGMDRAALFRRVHARFCSRAQRAARAAPGAARAAPAAGSAPNEQETMPTARALVLARSLLACFAGADGAAADEAGVQFRGAADAAIARSGLAGRAALSADEFARLLDAATRDAPAPLLFLACDELFGVAAAPQSVLDEVGALFDRVTASRAGGAQFAPAALAALCVDAGFAADERGAARVLADRAALSVSAAELERDDFVDFVLSAALASGVGSDRVAGFLQTYAMLHLSGLREAAGVRPV